ncbi:MAG: type I 3-dehydroquinate dehydratase [Halobacteriota archaeon]
MSELSFESFVLAASTADLSIEPTARGLADAIEFRADLASDPIAALDRYAGQLPVIVTNRADWEGGQAGDERERFETLHAAIEYDAVAAVDIELAALNGTAEGAAIDRARNVRDVARERGVAVIASVHDFEATPPFETLSDLLSSAAIEGDVGKLATTTTDRGDALALLRATHEATVDGETVATMGMGEPGRHTRAVAPLYGSKIGYAPVDPEDATAPGQYDLETLGDLVTALDTTR